MQSDCWVVEIRTDAPLAPLETGLEEVLGALALANHRPHPQGPAILQGFFAAQPDEARLARVLQLASDGPPPDYQITYHPARDWLAENCADFPPLSLGRFWVHGSHITARKPARLSLKIDAAQAFGSGSHPTTAGCLAALQFIAKRQQPASVLDLGCGSAILAMAAARLWPAAQITASDIDPVSIHTARENMRQNSLSRARCQLVLADGLQHRQLSAAAPYQLGLANILAAPLRRMAPAIASVLARNGWLVLAGLLDHQARAVLAAYRAQGLVPVWQRVQAGWSILILRPAGRQARPAARRQR